MARQWQAEAGAFVLAAERGVHLAEGRHRLDDVGLGHADAGILHLQHQRAVLVHCAVDGHAPAGVGELTALDSRLSRICFTARGSALILGSWRSEEHTSELQSLMRHSYAVFCLKKKKNKQTT